MMGRKILLAVTCWLALSRTDADRSKDSAKLEDSVAEANAPRLYRSIPVGVYASASPYASFSFHVPTFTTLPKVAHVAPIKQESVIVENKHGFLKDSYGNKFVGSSQSLPYRTAFPQQYVQLQELPAHLAQPLVAAAPSFEYKQLSPHFFGAPKFKVQEVQAASPSTANNYAINEPYRFGPIRTLSPVQQQHATNIVGKSQRLEENSKPYEQNDHGAVRISNANKGTNAAIKLDTKPPVPLLDLSLLEPLTFENPLVPQVQHFLPRISSVTYHKLPQLDVDGVKAKVKEIMIQKIKSYDNADIEKTPKVNSLRQQNERPHRENEDKRDEQNPLRDVPNDSSYEINSPRYRERYNEKFVNYNKETQSEPVHYSYEMKSEKEPLQYNYVRTTKEPYREEAKNLNQNTKNDKSQNTKHLIYNFSPEENDDDRSNYDNSQQSEAEDFSDDRIEHNANERFKQQNQGKNYDKETHHHGKSEHREDGPHSKAERVVHNKEEHQHEPDENVRQSNHHSSPQKLRQSNHHSSPQKVSRLETLSVDNPNAHIQPVLQEHEENIRVLPTPKKYASIKVDPKQHIQPQNRDSRDPENDSYDPPRTHHRAEYHPEQTVEEKSKRIIITEEMPQEVEPNNKVVNDKRVEQDEKGEDDFGRSGYNNAAYSYPAYEATSKDSEKEIYNPEPYAPSKYQSDFDVEHSPFQQYVAESDDYPKSTRSNYKDARDKTKDGYYLDYAISKPESMLARFQQKEDYYKTYMHQKPEYLNDEDETNKKIQKQSAKYAAAPSIEYHASAQKPKHYFAEYKAAPHAQTYGYDYSKEAPKDNTAYATGPYQRLKTYTQFVEPQFQYGFEPSVLPRLLDSELAAMASNNRPENEKPLMRKKVYKENWYIKKTSTNARKPTS